MPRRNRPPRARPEPSSGLSPALGWGSRHTAEDGEWIVRSVPGAQARKTYRCPGCDHEITPGIAHVVAWPADETGSVTDRRHWHRPCWEARGRRGPTRKR